MYAVSCQLSVFDIIKYLNAQKIPHEFVGTSDIPLKSITIHSAKGEHPGLFVPLKGENQDGHDFVRQYLGLHPNNIVLCANYACSDSDAKMLERTIRVEDPLSAIQAIARAHRETLSTTVIGVTGSCGKTTVKNLLIDILQEKYKTLGTPGNLNNHIGLPLAVLQLTPDVKVAVLEMGMNHVGELSFLAKIARPTLAVIVNVGTAHVGLLGSVENVAKAKSELAMAVFAQHGPCFALTPYRKWFEKKIADQMRWVSPTRLMEGFSVSSASELTYSEIDLDLAELGVSEESLALVMAVAIELGVSADQVWEGLKIFKNKDAGLRGSLMRQKQHTFFMDCYNANPDSFRFSLNRVLLLAKKAGTPETTFIGWYGDMGELGKKAGELHQVVLELLLNTKFPHKRAQLYFFGPLFSHAFKKLEDVKPHETVVLHFFDSVEDAPQELEKLLSTQAPLFFHVKGSRASELEKAFEKYLVVNTPQPIK